jgi:hypothetical protein
LAFRREEINRDAGDERDKRRKARNLTVCQDIQD